MRKNLKRLQEEEENNSSSNSNSKKKQKITSTPQKIEFSLADLKYTAISASLKESTEDDIIKKYFEDITNLLTTNTKLPVGLDCEWCPPWFRSAEEPEERICTMQFYNPNVGALVLSTVGVKILPNYLIDFFGNNNILKVGVNIIGDGARIKRDFKTTVNGLLNLEQLSNAQGRLSMEKLVANHCPKKFHISKNSMESKVRLGDWSKFPLDNLQLKYASVDAVLSFTIFLFQKKLKWMNGKDFNINEKDKVLQGGNVQSVEYDPLLEKENEEKDQNELQKKKASSDKANSNFFIMHRNRSIVPPNLNSKEHPKGTKTCLDGLVIVASGVLDSFSRKEFAEYVKKHGGKISKSITRKTSFLVNDHGTVGPSKFKKCQANNIPVVGEDHILELVRKNSNEDSCSSVNSSNMP